MAATGQMLHGVKLRPQAAEVVTMERPAKSPAKQTRRGAAAEPVARTTAGSDHLGQRTGPDTQRWLTDAIHSGASMTAQRRLIEGIQNSPSIAAQRLQIRRTFGDAAQFAGGPKEEELLQGKFVPVQRAGPQSDPTPRENDVGLPDKLKFGIESLSGISMDNVKVHYNSSQPAQLNALAYAQGRDIHIAPRQEKHLPHEAWHVVQQAQGRVRPTIQVKGGIPVNDDKGLEEEADVMGAKALSSVIQKVGPDDEEALQGKIESAQLMGRDTQVVQRILNGVAPAGRQAWQHGLVHGGYDAATNIADVHIAVGGPGLSLTKAPMLAAVQDIYQAMQASQAAGNPAGVVEMRPQGAVALKTVVELLGSALGGWWGKAQAAFLKLVREQTKTLTKSKLSDELDPVVIPEHMAFIGALIAVGGVSIQPIIPDDAPTTLAEFNQNILASTAAGATRRARYKAALEADTAVSMRVSVQQNVLPSIIAILQ